MEYYVGRLIGRVTLPPEQWLENIALAEALLIHAHGPAYNSQSVKEAPRHGNVRVLNWGAVRSLHREVSGLMWSHRAEEFRAYPAYDAGHLQPQVAPPVMAR